MDISSGSILLVEDDEKIRELLAQYLINVGKLNVFTARNGLEGLEVVKKEKIDIVITDMNMPEMNGIEFIKEAHAIHPEQPFIILTGFGDESVVVDALRLQVRDYFKKPVSMDELLKSINHLYEEITLKKELELSKIKLEEQRNEMDSLKEDLISMLIHDLKNPLSIIYSNLKMWEKLDLFKKDEFLSLQLEVTQKATHLLSDMIHEQLKMKKIEDGKYEIESHPVDVNEIVSYLYLGNREQFNEGLTFSYEVADDFPLLLLDESLSRRLLDNIFTNALKHTYKGNITISSTYNEDDKQATITISDTGVGIPAEDIPYLFDRYYQASSNRKRRRNYGIGLAFCDFAIKAMQGTIEVKSEVDKGSDFIISIPAEKDDGLCKSWEQIKGYGEGLSDYSI
ncbi:MAG: response regulator [Nitrospinae bacterium]|nr:response regulator [Nitrospinota bacterium]